MKQEPGGIDPRVTTSTNGEESHLQLDCRSGLDMLRFQESSHLPRKVAPTHPHFPHVNQS